MCPPDKRSYSPTMSLALHYLWSQVYEYKTKKKHPLLTGRSALKAALLGGGLDRVILPRSGPLVASTKIEDKKKR